MHSVLIIEDDSAIREAVVDILELEGYRAFSAEDGLAGVTVARKECPTLIVCDITMPYLDGYGVLAELRKHADTATIPFIFLTARSTANDVRQGMNLGADDYVTKPFSAEELLRTIQARIERQSVLAEKLQQRVNDLQKNLMSVLPHELNTPLHGIMAGVEFLREEYATLEKGDVDELLWIIHQSALRMRRLVANFLLHADLERLAHVSEAAAFVHQIAPVNVAPTLETVLQQEAAAATRQADIRLQLADASLRILPQHFSKIVEELVNNALQYSDPGSPVEIVCRTVGEHFSLSVKDYGRGMSREEIAQISAFQQFQRHHYEQQGLGLGLTLIQRLLELYRGQFHIASMPGEFTQVEIRLPLAR
jgi:signal transduction histidine kinase